MTRSKVLRHTLVVRHPETMSATALLAGEPVPEWASDMVDADDLESAGTKDDAADEEPKPPKRAAAKRSS